MGQGDNGSCLRFLGLGNLWIKVLLTKREEREEPV